MFSRRNHLIARLLDPSSLVPTGFVVDDVPTKEDCLIVHKEVQNHIGLLPPLDIDYKPE